MTSIEVQWEQIKEFVDARNVSIQYVDYDGNYYLKVQDGYFSLSTILSQEDQQNADLIDFETNYKPNGNKKLETKDSDGTMLQRLKVTTSGWTLHYHGLEITTSKLNAVTDLDHANNDWGFCTTKLYKANGDLITLEEDLPYCVKTVVDWEPTFNFDIIGGYAFQYSVPSTDIRVSIMGVPDIPANLGGSKVFMTGLNLKHLGTAGMSLDGRTPKSLVYSEINHTSKIRFIFWHDAGVSHTMLTMMNIFKA